MKQGRGLKYACLRGIACLSTDSYRSLVLFDVESTCMWQKFVREFGVALTSAVDTDVMPGEPRSTSAKTFCRGTSGSKQTDAAMKPS
jgi:hypothetical protein